MTRFFAYAGEAVTALWRNRTRSMLTILGMIIGSSSIIAVFGISKGAAGGIQAMFNSFGPTPIFVFVDSTQDYPDLAQIRYEDLRRVQEELGPQAAAVEPIYQSTMPVRHGSITHYYQITDDGSYHPDQLVMAQGRKISAEDLTEAARVADISSDVAQRFFGDTDALGKDITVGGNHVTVIGVYPAMKGSLFSGTIANTIFLPYTTFYRFFPGSPDGLQVYPANEDNAAEVGDLTKKALQHIHGSRAQYNVQDGEAFVNGFENVLNIVAVGLSAIGGVALLVAGIGIMNIMLVSVTERTREIGIRRSIGASRADIATQFLMEAILLALAGGVTGMLLGLAVTVGGAELDQQTARGRYHSVRFNRLDRPGFFGNGRHHFRPLSGISRRRDGSDTGATRMIYLQEALSVLFANKVRSLLTMLGLIIGVGAVVAIQTLGSSMAGAINGTLAPLSDDTFFVFANSTQNDYQKALISQSDINALATLPNVRVAYPLTGASDLVKHAHRQARLFISGDAAEPFNTTPLKAGRRISQGDVDERANVAVISDRAYQRLFAPGANAVGEAIYVGPQRYEVVGVLTPPKTGLLNAQFGGDVSAPYTTVIQQYMRGSKVQAARIVVDDTSQIGQTEVAVIKKLRDLHGDPNLEYDSTDKSQITRSISSVFGVMTIVVGVIGAISLLVAGIGIMNIMLVSVTERTREIGVRKAIGANRAQILVQFFIEALLLCGIGCGIGCVIGLLIGGAVNSMAIIKLTGYVAPLPWVQSLIIAGAFAAVVTLAFGTYPAYRAAALDPIEALRYE